MARFNPTIGTFSGKVGGLIYSFNNGGFYVRNYVPQTWAGTAAQVNAKNNFSQNQIFWSSLSDSQKAQWQSFADSLFSSLAPKKGLKLTGRNAASALNCTILSCNQMTRVNTLQFGSTTIMHTTHAYASNTTPPNYRLDGTLQDHLGNSLNLSFSSISVTATGLVTAVFTINAAQTYHLTFRNFQETENLGIMFYCSNDIPVTRNFFIQVNYFVIASTSTMVTSGGVAIPSYNQITITFPNTDIVTTNYKKFIQTGNKVRISAYLVSSSGQKHLIGSLDTIVI